MKGKKTKIISLLITFSFCLSLGIAPATGRTAGAPEIRVKLDAGLTAAAFRVMSGNYRLYDAATGREIARPKAGEAWTVTRSGGRLEVAPEGGGTVGSFNGPIELDPVDAGELNIFRYNNIRYRGSLRVKNTPEGLLVINRLDLEEYLLGVVGREMGTNAGMEALKAQAVVSRSYALSMRQPERDYDVTTGTDTQVYGGYEAELLPGAERVKEAVEATRGQVLYYKGQLVKAYFHANAGGYTENSENVWLEALPYLRATPSPEDAWAARYPYQNDGWPASSYEWTKVLSRREAQAMAEAWAGKQEEKGRLGILVDLVLSRHDWTTGGQTASGRVTEMNLIGTEGALTAYRDAIRSVFGLKSTLFDVQMDSTVFLLGAGGRQEQINYGAEIKALGAGNVIEAPNGNQGSYVVAGREESREVPKMFTQLVFSGKGHGHGLGLSQWGARGMAEKGYNYRQILEYYYNQGRRDGNLTIGQYRAES
ncbi:MAG: stage sporulation protein [Clostridia bacterium]|nr:stage sporulation protein [Clostridia bacterium]